MLSIILYRLHERYAQQRNNNVVYICRYHVVFCPKYRRTVLTPSIDERLKGILAEQIERWGQELMEMAVMPDHVHLSI